MCFWETITHSNSCNNKSCYFSVLTPWTWRIIWDKSHLGNMQPARWGHQGWYRLPGPPLQWSCVQLMDICHSPTTADPATLRAAMKYVWNKMFSSGGPSANQWFDPLLADAEYIYYTLSFHAVNFMHSDSTSSIAALKWGKAEIVFKI